MRFPDLIKASMKNINRTRNRSALTMLGIVIGVMSVITVLSIGEAAQGFIVGQISFFGSDLLMVMNGPPQLEGGATPTPFIKETLTVSDFKKLSRQPWVKLITGAIRQQDVVSARGQNSAAQIIGTTPDELEMYDMQMEQGGFFTQEHVESRSKVAVLGATIAEKSFGFENPIGQTIKLNEESFRIIGVMKKSGTRFFQNVDAQVYVPYSAAMDVYGKKRLTIITIKVSGSLNEAKMQAEILMREQHDIINPDDDDFHVHTQEDVIKTTSQITDILQIFLTSIAAISLVVVGIGIMNIMYVSVTERTREIGLRKALGAKRSDILRQFLSESIILTVVGGIIGLAAGIGATWLGIQVIIMFQTGWSFGISMNGILLGLGISTAVGIIFGYAPARRAASLNPIEALRYE